ncbi:hypothetical protein SMICM17S_00507 [Streptomyces microflavus]
MCSTPAARKEAEEVRGAAEAAMAQTRSRTASVLAHQEQEHADRHKAAEAEIAAAEAELEARHAELTERAEALLAEAARGLAEAQEAARHGQEDAEARAAEVLCGGPGARGADRPGDGAGAAGARRAARRPRRTWRTSAARWRR